jgi:hypothetical protein
MLSLGARGPFGRGNGRRGPPRAVEHHLERGGVRDFTRYLLWAWLPAAGLYIMDGLATGRLATDWYLNTPQIILMAGTLTPAAAGYLLLSRGETGAKTGTGGSVRIVFEALLYLLVAGAGLGLVSVAIVMLEVGLSRPAHLAMAMADASLLFIVTLASGCADVLPCIAASVMVKSALNGPVVPEGVADRRRQTPIRLAAPLAVGVVSGVVSACLQMLTGTFTSGLKTGADIAESFAIIFVLLMALATLLLCALLLWRGRLHAPPRLRFSFGAIALVFAAYGLWCLHSMDYGFWYSTIAVRP